MYRRYAIYFTPAPDSALAKFGASWLGWDSATGLAAAHPESPLDVATITATPRKYGFHGTIKPPFRLADGQDANALSPAVEELAAALPPCRLEGLVLARLGRFLALVPSEQSAGLARLAASVVRDLDQFRAPPTEAELAKRRAAGLTAGQEANLITWGYPYVMEQFRFHLTLSGKLDGEALEQVENDLKPRIAQLTLAPYDIDALTLLGEADDGLFHQLARFDLSG